MEINKQKIICLLAEREMTRKALAEECNMLPQSLCGILRRGYCEPKTAGRIAKGLNVEVSEITKVE